MPPERIRDIPQFRKLIEEIDSLSRLKTAFPILKPFLRILGVDVSTVERAFAGIDLDELERRADTLTSTPDRFNELFGECGWIMYGDMNLEVATTAIAVADEEGLEAGERVLLNYYDSETVSFHLNRMQAVQAFRPRMRLARKALADFREDRYHACIPVVLALLDGLVQEVHAATHGEARAFSSEDADLTAWDSIAGHSSGLEVLAGLMRKGRRKTREAELTVPYRNGILHGMDLGYDNRIVAAKVWAALFAVREWALKAEQGELEGPNVGESDPPTLLESLRRLEQTRELQRKLENWRPREIVVGEDLPETGAPEAFPEGTPTRSLVEFLSYWMLDNFGHMASVLRRVGTGDAVEPGAIRSEFEYTALKGFTILAVEDFSPAFTDITLDLHRESFGRDEHVQVLVRMTYMKADGSPAAFGVEEGKWYLTTRLNLVAPGLEMGD